MGTFRLLAAADLDLTVDPVDFEQTLSDTLGNLGTPTDGFDPFLGDTITLLLASGDIGAVLDDDLAILASILPGIDPLSLASDASSLPASIATGESILADANDLLGSIGVVTPPPAPGGGGSSGMPIGDATAFIDATTCSGAVPWPGSNTVPLPHAISVPLTNQSQSTVQIASITLVQPHPGVFTATTDCNGTLAPGATCNVVITQHTFESNGIIFALDLQLSTPNLKERICLQVGLIVGGSPGGGGGGGSPIFNAEL